MRKVMVMFGLCALFFGIKAVGQTLTPKDTLAFRQCLNVEMWPCTDVLFLQKLYQDIEKPDIAVDDFQSPSFGLRGEAMVFSPTSFLGKSYMYGVVHANYYLKECYKANSKEGEELEKAKQALVDRLKAFDENSDSKPLFFADIKSKYGGDYAKYVDALVENSMVTNKGRLKKFLPRHRAKWLTIDMGFQFTLGLALYEMAVREMRTQGKE